jgi:hypothetical protein
MVLEVERQMDVPREKKRREMRKLSELEEVEGV